MKSQMYMIGMLAVVLTSAMGLCTLAQAGTIVFSDDFDGSALGSSWVGDGSPEVDAASSISVGSGLVTLQGAVSGYCSMWGGADMFDLGTSTDWEAAVKFKVSGNLTTTVNRDVKILTSRLGQYAIGDNVGVDFRAVQDSTGADGATYSLGWNGFGDAGGDPSSRVATVLATLNKDQFYTVTAHRKSDGNVDVFLDGDLISTQAVLGTDNPQTLRIGEGGSVSGMNNLSLDYINITANPIPEPCSMALLAIAGLGLSAYAWRKRKP